MPESVIVDDGGSTRIKWSKSGILGSMDALLDVDDLGAPRKGSEHTIKSNFSQVRIVYQDEDGKPWDFTVPLVKDVLISSHQDQNVLLERTVGGDLKITVYSDKSEPLIEAKQHRKKRRYVVSNSGTIEKVKIDGNPVYDTGIGGGPTIPAGINKPVMYTSVVLT